MDELETWLTTLLDLDAAWWPFVALRPREDEPLADTRIFALAALYGVFAGAFTNAVAALAGAAHGLSPFLFPLGATAAFFLLFRFTFAWAWNRRAARSVPTRDRLFSRTPDSSDPPEGA
jgi:hypothetical protein